MANIKSAEKRIGQAARRHQRNQSARSRLKSAVKAYRATEGKATPEAFSATVSEIDVARKKGIIHRNAAARYKSRLAKKAKAR